MSGMTKERLQHLRKLADSNVYTGLGDYWNAIEEMADEIERLQAGKPAPTKEQVADVLQDEGMVINRYHGMLKPYEAVQALAAANLLEEPKPVADPIAEAVEAAIGADCRRLAFTQLQQAVVNGIKAGLACSK